MPIYTYRCNNCGVQFERHQKFSEPSLKRCPECSKNTLRKIYLPVGIVFKGSGFYSTDNRSSPGKSGTAGQTKTSKSAKDKLRPIFKGVQVSAQLKVIYSNMYSGFWIIEMIKNYNLV